MKNLKGKYKKISILLIFISVILRSMATICGKKAAILSTKIGILSLYKNLWFGLEIFFFSLQALTWILVLKKFKLSFAYPFMSLVYFFNLLAAYLVFNEQIYFDNIVGLLFVLSGIIIISKEKSKIVYE